MLYIKNSNGYAALILLVLVFIIITSWVLIAKPFAMVYNKFTTDDQYSQYVTEQSCNDNNGNWWNSACHSLPERASTLTTRVRVYYFAAPIILIVGLIIWFITVSLKRDPQQYRL